jgi:hypothetical protein
MIEDEWKPSEKKVLAASGTGPKREKILKVFYASGERNLSSKGKQAEAYKKRR